MTNFTKNTDEKTDQRKRKSGTTRKKRLPKFKHDKITKSNYDEFLECFPIQHKKFADYFMQKFNATKAYALAYPKANNTTAMTNGHKLLKDKLVTMYITYRGEKLSQQTEYGVEEVEKDLQLIKNRSLQAEPVRDQSGKIIPGIWQYRDMTALKSIELLGKQRGMFNNKPQIDNLQSGKTKIIVRTMVVPAIKNIVPIPKTKESDIKKLIEQEINARIS